MENTMTKIGAVETTGALPRVWSELSYPVTRRLAVTLAPVQGGTLPASAAHGANVGPITAPAAGFTGTATVSTCTTVNDMNIFRFRTDRPPV